MYDNIIIDATNLFYRSVYFGLKKEISSKSISKTFFEIINDLKNKFEFEKNIYFLYDDSKILFRKQLNPNYKINRSKNKIPSNILSLLGLTKEILSVNNNQYRILSSFGYEADDFVKPLLKFLNGKNLLISNDLDFCKSINLNTDWYNWSIVLNEVDFVKTYNFYPNDEAIKLYKALKGDKSNGVQGINLNDEIIVKICQKAIDYNSFENFKNDLDWISRNERIKILKNFDRLVLNYQLSDNLKLEKQIIDYIIICEVNKLKEKILLESIGLEIKLSNEDLENQFFNLL